MGLKDRLPRRGSLGSKAMNAGMWSLVQISTTHLFRLLGNLVMTRLLMPDAFGLMAMVFTVLTALNLFTDIGIGKSIVREKDGEDARFLRVAWTIKCLRGVMIAACVLVAAVACWVFGSNFARPDTVYADPRLPLLIAISALTPLLAGAESTAKDLTVRRLENWRFTALGIIGQVLSIFAMIGFAWLSPTVWALMAGMMVSNIFYLVSSHLFFPGPRMRFEWDQEISDRLWRFGKWLLGSSAFTFVARNADRLILASLLGAGVFGLYVIAQIWIEAGKTLIMRLSDRVGFPAISAVIRTRPQELPRLFRKFQRVIDVFCVSAFLGAWLLGPRILEWLYTPEYHEAGDYLALLSVAFLVMRSDTLSSLVLNLGHSRSMMMISVIRAVAICVFLPLGYMFLGLEGAILAGALSPNASLPYTLRLLHPTLGRRQTLLNLGWLVGTFLAAVVVYVWH